MIKGSLVALVTPMDEEGNINYQELRNLIDWHVANETDGIVIVGTTGESPTVSIEEHVELIKVTVEHANGRIPVIAGTGANSTTEAIELTKYAKEVGATAGLSVAPYYNKPTQEGLYQHFKKVAEAVDLPMILYNVPGRTVSDLNFGTTKRLSQIDNIIGIKDATGNIERGTALILNMPEDFAIYSGDDGSALALMLLGGHGVISVTANVAPKLMHQMCTAAFSNKSGKAKEINAKLFPLHQNLFLEANPIPVKWALYEMGLISKGIRLPLTPLSPVYQATLRDCLTQAKIKIKRKEEF